MLKERYLKTAGILTPQEIVSLHEKKVCIIGCGGLGGNIIEMITRAGVLNLTIADRDVFSQSNLNRQILCTEKNLKKYKVDAAALRIKEINSEVKLTAYKVYLNEENANDLLTGHDVIVDALDNIPSRLLLEKYAEKLNIPFVHGAIQGWFAQIAVVKPGDRTLERLYGKNTEKEPSNASSPPFAAAFCASLQVSETLKLLCGKKTLESNHLLVFDLYDKCINTFIV